MWLAVHDGVITFEISLHKNTTEAGTQTAEPVVVLTACLFSFVAGEHEMQPSGTCYHPNCHRRRKILLILRNLSKQQVINTKNTVFHGKTRHPCRNLAQKNLSHN